MKHIIPLFTFTFCLHLAASAAVPCPWTVEMTRAQPATFEYYQGETIAFEATLTARGKPFEAPSNYSFFWQTNGMGNLYWEAPQQGGAGVPPAQSNVLFATWLPSYDCGALVYKCFIGSPSNNYHTAFQLRLMPSPGATPNALPLPVPVIDFAKVRVLNPPWSGGGGGGVDTNAVERIANNAVETNAVTVATTNRVTTLETATNNLTTAVSGLQSSKLDGPTDTSLTMSGKAADAHAVRANLSLHDADDTAHSIAFSTHNQDSAAHPDKISTWGGTVGGQLTFDGGAAWLYFINDSSIHIPSTDTIVIDDTNTLSGVLSAKADRPADFDSSHAGNIAALDENGNLSDSEKTVDDFMPKTGGTFDGDVNFSNFSVLGGFYNYVHEFILFGEDEDDTRLMVYDTSVGVYNGDVVADGHSLRAKADRSMIHHTNTTFSNEVAEVARTVQPAPSPTLRLFDPVLNRWVILKSVNMNITLEVE